VGAPAAILRVAREEPERRAAQARMRELRPGKAARPEAADRAGRAARVGEVDRAAWSTPAAPPEVGEVDRPARWTAVDRVEARGKPARVAEVDRARPTAVEPPEARDKLTQAGETQRAVSMHSGATELTLRRNRTGPEGPLAKTRHRIARAAPSTR
jgi:hypothetical protein